MIILGIDPGTAITGFGVIAEADGGRLSSIDHGCVRTLAGKPTATRLLEIYTQIGEVLDTHSPDLVAIEQLFFNRNVTTALAVGHARGVIMLAAAERNLEIMEFTPLQVKQAVTGYGRADKRQVQSMVKGLLHLEAVPKPDDAADALATAICCSHHAAHVRAQMRAER